MLHINNHIQSLTHPYVIITMKGWALIPLYSVPAVSEWYQKPLLHRKFQLACVCQDHHVGAGQRRTEIIEMDSAVISNQTNSQI